jgi:hypothetical protein
MKRLILTHHAHPPDGFYAAYVTILRIIHANATRFKDLRRPRTRDHHRSCHPLERSNSSGMIVMCVRIQDQLHIFNPKTKLPYMIRNLCSGFRNRSVNQYVSMI